MSGIDPRAAVDPAAVLGEDVSVGPFAVIEANAVLGNGCRIGPNAVIHGWVRLGNEVKVSSGAVLGGDPQDLKFGGEETFVEIGDRTVIRECVTVNRGTAHSGKTSVGADCLLMAYSHVAHDCRIGDKVILANGVNMGGHVHIDDWAIIGGLVPIHQFTHIGKHVMVGGGWRVPKDVPPYIRAAGSPLDYKGLNSIGLRRRSFSSETIATLKKVYRILYRSHLNVSQALVRVRDEVEMIPEVQEVLQFIENESERGIMGRARKDTSEE